MLALTYFSACCVQSRIIDGNWNENELQNVEEGERTDFLRDLSTAMDMLSPNQRRIFMDFIKTTFHVC